MTDKKKKIEKYLEADQIGRAERSLESSGASLDSSIKMEIEKAPTAGDAETSESVSEKAEAVTEDRETESPEGELEKARREAGEIQDKYLRLYADFENYRKRTARETADYRKYANETLLREILDVVDNLERALGSFHAHSESDSALVKGVQLTLNEILAILERNHVTPIDAVGKPFDPRYHQAFQQEETDEYPADTVAREYQKGFLLHDRLLRPSMVSVAKRRAKPASGPE